MSDDRENGKWRIGVLWSNGTATSEVYAGELVEAQAKADKIMSDGADSEKLLLPMHSVIADASGEGPCIPRRERKAVGVDVFTAMRMVTNAAEKAMADELVKSTEGATIN